MKSYKGVTLVKVAETKNVKVISCNERSVYIGNLANEYYELSNDGCIIKFYQYFGIDTEQSTILNDKPLTYEEITNLIDHYL